MVTIRDGKKTDPYLYGILCYTRKNMRTTSLGILFCILFAAISCGCLSGNQSGPTATLTPAPEAVGFRDSGFKAYLAGDNATALDFYNRSLALDPQYTRAWIDKGDVLSAMNRSQEAVAAYDSALNLDNSLAIVWNSRGVALMATGNYTAARDSFDRALRIAPQYDAAIQNRELALKKVS